MSALMASHPYVQAFTDAKNAIVQDYSGLENIAKLKNELKLKLDDAEERTKYLDAHRYRIMAEHNKAQEEYQQACHATAHIRNRYERFIQGLKNLDIFEIICNLGERDKGFYCGALDDFTALVTGDLAKSSNPEIKDLVKLLGQEETK